MTPGFLNFLTRLRTTPKYTVRNMEKYVYIQCVTVLSIRYHNTEFFYA